MQQEKKKKNHNRILMLAKSKFNSIETNVSSINWHGNKLWRIYYNFKGER